VHGCFWHRHPDPECKLARLPKSRLDFWIPKLEGNRARDERVKAKLEEMGWRVVEIWECQTKPDALAKVAARIKKMTRN
jgi:DNA mismatch endonuclease, patch repair protein